MKPSTTLGIGVLLAGLVLAGCSDDDDASPSPGEATTTAPTDATDESNGTDTPADDANQPTTTGEPDESADGGEDDSNVISASDGVLSDGVWAVGDAGTVEFVLRDGQLELVEVLANDGWRVSIDERSPDEIEVDFERDNLEYEIEIEYENGILEIEIDLDIDPAEAGSFEIGPAGVVTVSVVDGRVVLDDLAVAEGWTVVEQDTDDGEVEVELRQGNMEWEFEAEFDDGRLEVEIDFEIEGQFP